MVEGIILASPLLHVLFVALARSNIYLKNYVRRKPEGSLLYRIVRGAWPLFLGRQKEHGKKLPLFIHDEFNQFLECEIVEHGFVRTYCYQCRHSGIVAFSCKRRGFCPSCCAQRMTAEAAFLVDQVLPDISYRQWVLSFPFKLRFLMAHKTEVMNQALKIFIRAIAVYQRKKAKKSRLLKPQTGAITFVQRFGSALNLNIHFHILVPDGVFIKRRDGDGYDYRPQTAPTSEDLLKMAKKIHKKLLSFIQKKGFDENFQESFEGEDLTDLSAMAIANQSGFGERAGKGVQRRGRKTIEVEREGARPSSANWEGFSLNAQVFIPKHKRKKLERLIRYMARGPLAMDRLSEPFPGQLVYQMKTAWRDGTTEVCFSRLDFIARLVALIPPPRANLVRYHGCFAPNFKDRKEIVKRPVPASQQSPSKEDPSEKGRQERLRWAEMLKRVFEIDVTVCPKCSGRMEQIAVIKDKAVARQILESMNVRTIYRPLDEVEDRGPPQQEGLFSEDWDQRGESW